MRQLDEWQAVKSVTDHGDWLRVRWRDRNSMRNEITAGFLSYVPTYEADVDPVRRWMADTDVELQRPRAAFLDIETDSRATFQEASDGLARVLCWSTTNSEFDTVQGVLADDDDDAEREILLGFWQEMASYDLIAAWSGDAWSDNARASDVFDFRVMWKRSERLGLKVNTRRWLWLSYLKLFQRLNISASDSGDEKQSMKLGDIGASLGVGTKDDFDAAKTWEYWRAGGRRRQMLCNYNVVDTELIPKIDAVTNFLDIHYEVSRICNTFPDTRGMNPSTFVDAFMLKLGGKHNVHFPTAYGMADGQKYPGALVLEPKRGAHRDVHVVDFSGMYPSIMMSWNMSPETLVKGKLAQQIDPGKDVFKGLAERGWSNDINPILAIPPNTCAAPLTHNLFRTDVKGMFPLGLESLTTMRGKIKKELAATPADSDRWKELDRASKGVKTIVNSFYGIVGNLFSRFYSRSMAESVTGAGVWLLANTIQEASRCGMATIFGDTDSGAFKNVSDDEIMRFVKRCNEKLYPELLKDHHAPSNYIKLGYEKKFGLIVIIEKKRYFGKFSHYEGTPVVGYKAEIKGMEYKRGDTARLARQLQERIMIKMLQEECFDPDELEKIVVEFKEFCLFGEVPKEDVVIAKSLGKPLGDYVETGTSPLPAHVKVARQIAAKGARVTEGTRVEYVITDASKSPQVVIPAEEFDGNFDRHYLWMNAVYPPTFRVLVEAANDVRWKRHEKTRPKPVDPRQTGFGF